jgi:ribosomal protein S18 acetylase RimI-like enzyme
MLRLAAPADTPTLVALGVATGLFQPEEADLLLRAVLDDMHAGRLGEGHLAYVWADGPAAPPAGWVYFSPEAKADGVWELWWIGVDPTRQGQGIGDDSLRFVEDRVRDAGGRLLLISTSSLPLLERTRRFYAKRGYAECGRIPDYYADGDDKVVFVKRVAAPAPVAG